MKRASLLGLRALCRLPLVAARAAEVPIPPAPTRWATDTAGFMSPQALQAVDRTLEDFERATGNQVLVWIGDTTGDAPLEDWTVRAFERWKVGRKGLDNGLILFVFANDRSARIEVGYGLEGKVPDAIASRILNEVILPRIRGGGPGWGRPGWGERPAGHHFGGRGRGHGGRDAGREERGFIAGPDRRGRPMSYPQKVLVGLLVLGFLILLVTNPSLALYLLFSILSGGRGGGGGGGGGFSGGGGSSGGGGASGRGRAHRIHRQERGRHAQADTEATD